MKHTKEWYEPFVGPGHIKTSIDEIPSSHCIPTIQSVYPAGYQAKYPPNTCGQDGLPFLQLCNYDGAGAALQHRFKGTLKNRTAVPFAAPLEYVQAFNQTPFFESFRH